MDGDSIRLPGTPAWPDADYYAAKAEDADRQAGDPHDRMARNRAHQDRRPMSHGEAAAVDPMDRQAFREVGMKRDVDTAKDALERAKCAVRAAAGRQAKDKARRIVARLSRALGLAESTLAAEVRDAPLADAVQRTAQVQDGTTLRDARVAVRGKRVEQVTALDRLLRDGSLTRAQHAALDRYRRAHEAAAEGLYGTGLDPDSVGGGSPGSGNARIERAVADGVLLAQMRAALFPRGVTLVEHVAVHGLTVTSWALRQVTATRTGMDPKRAMGLLEAAADVLARVK